MFTVRAYIKSYVRRLSAWWRGCNCCKQGERADMERELIQLTGCPESRTTEMGSMNPVPEEGRRPVEGVLGLGFGALQAQVSQVTL